METTNKQNYTISFRVGLSIVCVSIALTIASCIFYRIAYHKILIHTENKLNKIAQKTKEKIIDLIVQQRSAVTELTTKDPIISAFSGSFDKEKLTHFIAQHKDTIFYTRVLLVKSDGTFIFSTHPDKIVGKKMTPQDYLESYFSESFMQAVMTRTVDISVFDVDSLFNEPILFLCAPVFDQGKVVGVLAVQLNEEKFYHILASYHNLGTTGETILGNQISGGGGGSLIISPTRHAPNIAFKHLGALDEETSALLRLAIIGKFDVGTGYDYRGKEVVGAWDYIPMLNWGLLTKQDLSEIKKELAYLIILYYILLALSCLLCTWFLIQYHTDLLSYALRLRYLAFISRLSARFVLRLILLAIIIACFFLSILLLINFHNQKKAIAHRMTALAQKSSDYAAHEIGKNYLNIIEMVADTIAIDLTTDHLKKEDIMVRIKRTLSEYWYEIAEITIAYEPYAYDKTVESYARSITRTADKQFSEQIITDYHNHDGTRSKNNWYDRTIKNGPQWFDPIINSEKKQPTALYTIPFFWPDKKKVRGVLAIKFNMQFIFDTVDSIVIGKTGYVSLIDSKGTFFFYPTPSYIKNRKTILDIAREQGNNLLQEAAHDMLAGNKAQKIYVDKVTQQKILLSYQPLKPTHWVLAISFPEQEITLGADIVRHTMIWLLIAATIALLCIVLSIILAMLPEKPVLSIWSTVSTTLSLALALVCLWFIIIHTSLIIDTKGTIITQPTGLDRFIQEIKQEAERKSEPALIPIPVGILIYALNFPDPHHINMTARIWQRYNPQEYSNNILGVQIPNAKQVAIQKIFEEDSKNQDSIGWKIETLLPQNYNYKLFPFDVLHTVVQLEQSDITKNILLIPDLNSYTSLAPTSLPGIQESLALSGFTIQQTFFSFESVAPITNFGMRSYSQITDRMLLHYNIIITRALLNPLVIYFLPLLVVLISLFAIFWLAAQRSPEDTTGFIFGVLSAYTGLFFALLLLHRTLRSEYPVGEILYIEYLFFYTYLTILLFIIHAVFIYIYTKSDRLRFLVSRLISLLFWPSQLLLWFITTIIIFY